MPKSILYSPKGKSIDIFLRLSKSYTYFFPLISSTVKSEITAPKFVLFTAALPAKLVVTTFISKEGVSGSGKLFSSGEAPIKLNLLEGL